MVTPSVIIGRYSTRCELGRLVDAEDRHCRRAGAGSHAWDVDRGGDAPLQVMHL
jgi:hypothetical protein